MKSVLILLALAVVVKYGVVDPPAVFGHGGVDSRKLGISTSFSPGYHAVDAALAYKWTTRVPLKQQDRRKHQG